MTGRLLVVNAGSSSIKFSVYDVAHGPTPLTVRYRGEVDGLGARPRFAVYGANGELLAVEALSGDTRHDGALRTILDWVEARAAGVELVAA